MGGASSFLPINGMVGSAIGSIAGLTANQTEGSRDAGNVWAEVNAPDNLSSKNLNQSLADAMSAQKANTAASAQNQVMNSPLYGQLFGQGGQMQNTGNQINQLMNSGFQLQPQDYQMYGQAAGQLARNTGGMENSLAQALASRGLSNSGVANQQFMTAEGNKNEQLGQQMLQLQQNRFAQNMQQLQGARQYMSQLGAQAQGAVGQTYGQNRQNAMDQYGMGMDYLGRRQDQSNENLKQQVGTAHPNSLTNGLVGNMAGFAAGNSGTSPGSSMSGMQSPMAGAQTMAGTGMGAVKNGTYNDNLFGGGSYSGIGMQG